MVEGARLARVFCVPNHVLRRGKMVKGYCTQFVTVKILFSWNIRVLSLRTVTKFEFLPNFWGPERSKFDFFGQIFKFEELSMRMVKKFIFLPHFWAQKTVKKSIFRQISKLDKGDKIQLFAKFLSFRTVKKLDVYLNF